MTQKAMQELADRIEAALTVEEYLGREIKKTLRDLDITEDIDISEVDLDSTDQIFSLVHLMLPGWTISLKGKAWKPNGHWVCSLRKTSSRDNDEFVGVGRAPTLPHALLSALLRVQGQRSG